MAKRALVCLIVMSCGAAPCAAGAHEPASLNASGKSVDSTQAYACVDPADATARRRFQDEPCRLPLYQWPVTWQPAVDPTTRWPSYRSRTDADAAHPMFWRFPVQPAGPHGVPRHWR